MIPTLRDQHDLALDRIHQPVPVIDVRVRIDGKTEGLRPGQAVRVEVSDG